MDVELGASRLHCGIWRSEVGHWRIEMTTGEHELFTVHPAVAGCAVKMDRFRKQAGEKRSSSLKDFGALS
jgi:hypothetical protein